MTHETELIKRGTIAEKIKAYNEATALIMEGYKTLETAEEILKDAFSIEEISSSFDVLPSRNDHCYHPAEATKKVIENLKRQAWRRLYNALEIKRVMSIKRADETEKKLDSGDLPALTVEAVFEVFEMLHQNVDNFARESVIEVYDWIRPHDGYSGSQYKTNQKNARVELGKKIIHGYMVRVKYSNDGYQTQYNNEKYLIALDRVFHMLEGKNMLEKSYRSPLVDAINLTDSSGLAETEYFKCKCYQNGNLHIEFKRLDLVKQFNAIAGGLNLKPTN